MSRDQKFFDMYSLVIGVLAVGALAGAVYAYADLEAESARLARHLSGRGVRPGDRVSVQTEKSPEALLLYLACLRGDV